MKTFAGILVLFAGGALFAGGLPGQAQEKPRAEPTRVAVLNVSKFFDSKACETTREMQAQINDHSKKMEAQFQKLREDMQSLRERLRAVQEDRESPIYRKFEKELDQKEASYKVEMEHAKKEIEVMERDAIQTIFGQIEKVVAAVAAEKGIDLVLREGMPPTVGQFMDFHRKSVLFASPTIDLTDEVLARLDKDKKKTSGGGNPPAGFVGCKACNLPSTDAKCPKCGAALK